MARTHFPADDLGQFVKAAVRSGIMRWSISLGRVKGTAVRLHLTFLLLLAWLGVALYLQGGAAAAVSGLTFLLLLFMCVVLHEFGHILAARHFGVKTPEILLLPIGGMARLERIPERPREELLISLAGPAVTLAIAGLLILVLGRLPDPRHFLEGFGFRILLEQLAFANLTLLVFNLIPAFPLDGGRVLRALLSARMGHLRATRLAASIGKWTAIVLGTLGLMIGHVILMLVAVFIFVPADAEAGLAQLRAIAFNVPARDVMITAFKSLPRRSTLLEAAEALMRTTQKEFPVVDDEETLLGIVTRDDIVGALAERARGTTVEHIMKTGIPAISQWSRLDDGIRLLQTGWPAIAVTGPNGQLVGLVTWENLLEALMIEQAREKYAGGLAKRAVERTHPYLSG